MTALYRHFDKAGALLYVGISSNALSRAGQHFSEKMWAIEVVRFTVEHFPDREAALAAEKHAIITERPKYNITHQRNPIQRAANLAMNRQQGGRPPAEAMPNVELDLNEHLRSLEFSILVRALRQYGGNRTAAGRRLGLSLREMRYRLAKYNITSDYWRTR